jgi:hypothetical protein
VASAAEPRGQLPRSQPDAYLLFQFLGSRRVGWSVDGSMGRMDVVVGYGLTHFRGLVTWWVGEVVRSAYKFGGWLSADSAGCSMVRFSRWWRSVWVSVYGEGGFRTSVILASTVLFGYP